MLYPVYSTKLNQLHSSDKKKARVSNNFKAGNKKQFANTGKYFFALSIKKIK